MRLQALALRNLRRNVRRTLLTALSIALGVLLAVTFTGLGDYFYTNMIDAGAKMGMGHVTVQAKGYDVQPNVEHRIAHTGAMRAALLQQPQVQGANIRIIGQAMFASAHQSVGGALMAIDPSVESVATNLMLQAQVSGQSLSDEDVRGVLIGDGMAQKLHLKIGSKVIYTTTDIHGELVSGMLRVRGLFHTGVDMVDQAMGLIHIDQARSLIGYDADEATLIAVNITDQRKSEDVQMLAQDVLAPWMDAASLVDAPVVLNWKQSQPDLFTVILLDKSMNYISQLLIGLLIAAGIFNTMLMSVLERRYEFGVMLAVGMSPLNLCRLVLIESVWLAGIGVLFGALLSAPWFYYLHVYGLDFSASFGDSFSYGGVLIDPVMKARLFPESAAAIVGIVFALSMLASIYPAWKAGRTSAIESLKAG